MWHGAQTDARTSMRPLAQRVADSGPGVVVPDWNSQATDRGRADLLRSLQFARESSAEPDAMVLVGWSMGGTCAVDLAVMHPDMFSAFEDIAGDIAPNSGTKEQTISRLFGGNAAAYASFDPTTVITQHGAYSGLAGWFAINSQAAAEQSSAANTLCGLGNAHGITCAVVPQPGGHDWPYASQAFATALPWMASQLHTPGVPSVPLPTPPPPPPIVQVAAK